MTEREIINLCKSGDFSQFKELYEKYVDVIYKFIYYKTYDTVLTDDLTSETFLRVVDKINSFKNGDSDNFRAWIYRIAYNLIVDSYKKPSDDISTDDIEYEMGYSIDLGEQIDTSDAIKNIVGYLNTINPVHRDVIVMRIWEDLSFKDIAEISGLSLDNCKKIASRELKKIRKLFG